MNAGTLATLEPTSSVLESWARNPGETPALDVRSTQDRFDGTPIQQGAAASTVEDSRKHIAISGTDIEVDTVEDRVAVATEWAADVTGAGVVAAASVYESGGSHDFPFDLFTHNLSTDVERIEIDTEALADAWDSADALRDTWMRAARDDNDDFSVHYGATPEGVAPDAGVGFRTAWSGTVIQGVAWPSGYVALHDDVSAGEFLDFVSDEILPFAEVPEPDLPDAQQALLERAREGGDE